MLAALPACLGVSARPDRAPGERGAPNATAPARRDEGRVVGVALAAAAVAGRVSATAAWRLDEERGDGAPDLLARGTGGDPWRIERRARQLRAVRADGVPTAYTGRRLVARPLVAGSLLTWNGRRYRGELTFTAADTGLVVVNRVPVEAYLRGVVPVEMGGRTTPAEQAAVDAQAVAARSYAYARLAERSARGYDVVAGVGDQVYAGADAERPASDAAVTATRGLVLTYAGRVVNAPYHSTCGGSTADLHDAWPWRRSEPYLRRVSDRVPGTAGRYYCDASPRFSWSRTYHASTLAAALSRYLGAYSAVPAGGPGAARFVGVAGRTPAGRVAELRIDTDRGRFAVHGDDVRRVLRAPGGEILSSTYFTLESVVGRDGRLRELTVRGGGNGHGVGMCQWGALGRARAGQDYRTILRTYYPGTTIAPAE